ncbi:hypothetical protein [Escherichia phage dw-ec]|nr:hypothetical protein [Escherichia phage BI-EHEC]UJQ43768.1 hypothetical protein [Escherichia phage dw-ec]
MFILQITISQKKKNLLFNKEVIWNSFKNCIML